MSGRSKAIRAATTVQPVATSSLANLSRGVPTVGRRAMGNPRNPAVDTVNNPVAMAVVVSNHPPIMPPPTAAPRRPAPPTVSNQAAMGSLPVVTASPLVVTANLRNKCREAPPTVSLRGAVTVVRLLPVLVVMASRRAVMGSPRVRRVPRAVAMCNKHHRTPAVMGSLILVVGFSPKLLARTSMVSNHPRVVSTRRQASMHRNSRAVRSYLHPWRASR